MQHAGGAPLPPPHAPGQPPHDWAQPIEPEATAPLRPGAPPPAPGAPPYQPGPPPGSGPATAQLPAHPQSPPAPAHHPGAPHTAGTQQPPGQGWHGPAPQHASARPPSRDTTGHVALPPGGPVPIPQAPEGTGATTLAVLLIGPAGAGKTTVARYWAQHRRVPTAHISLDDVREWVCSGFADPQSGWNDHSEAQYRLARRTCGFAARNFLANGISCILDDAVFPDRPVVGLGGWKRHVGPGLLPVVLLPGLEVVLERNAERSGNRRLSDEEVAGHPRPHGRLVRLGPADHRQLPVRRAHHGPPPGRRPGQNDREPAGLVTRPPVGRAGTADAAPRSYARGMSEVFAVRRGWLRDRCAAAGSAAALVSRPANVRYLAGGAPPGAVLLVGPAEDVLLCPRTPSGDLIEGHLDEQLRLTVLPAPGGDPAVAAADLAQTSGADSLAVEEHHLSVARHRALGSVAPRLLLGDLGGAVEQRRLVKDEDEIACLRIAAEITDQALGELLESILVGRTERHLALELERRLVDHGADGPAFMTSVGTGPNSGRAGHRPADRGSRRATSSRSAWAPPTAATAARSAVHS